MLKRPASWQTCCHLASFLSLLFLTFLGFLFLSFRRPGQFQEISSTFSFPGSRVFSDRFVSSQNATWHKSVVRKSQRHVAVFPGTSGISQNVGNSENSGSAATQDMPAGNIVQDTKAGKVVKRAKNIFGNCCFDFLSKAGGIFENRISSCDPEKDKKSKSVDGGNQLEKQIWRLDPWKSTTKKDKNKERTVTAAASRKLLATEGPISNPSPSPSPSPSLAPSSDAAILLALKTSWQDPSNILASWQESSSERFCFWNGIRCSVDGRLFSVEILRQVNETFESWEAEIASGQAKLLSGQIPEAIGQLVTAVTFHISNQNLSGQLPKEIGKMSKLENLQLEGNQISGEIPENLGNLKNLKVLDLRSNKISGLLPEIFGQLKNLEQLRVDANMLNGSIPEELGQLKKLWRLTGSKNYLNGSFPWDLSVQNLNLTVLNFSVNSFSGLISPEIGNFSNLQSLDFSSNFFSGTIPTEIGQLKKLRSLNLAHNGFSGELPESLGHLKSLRTLNMRGNFLDGVLPESFGNLKKLSNLDLAQNNFSGELPENIKHWVSMKKFDIKNNLFSGVILPEIIFNWRYNLENFIVFNNNFSGSIPKTFADCPNLQVLDLSVNYFSGAFPESLCKNNRLKTLDFHSNKIFGPLPEDIVNCTELKIFSVETNFLNGSLPSSLGTQLKDIKSFRAGYNSFSGKLPEDFSGWSKLIEFSVENNSFSGPLPEQIGNLKCLEILSFQENNFSGSLPLSWANLSNLKNFNISRNILSGQIPNEYGNLQNLMSFSVGSNLLSGFIPKEIGNLVNLTALELGSNNFTGSLPEEIGQLVNIWKIFLSDNQFSGQIPKSFGNLKNLKLFRIQNNQLEGPIPEEFSDFGQLETILANDNKLTGNLGQHFFDSCPSLERLVLSNNFFSGEILSFMVNSTMLRLEIDHNFFSGSIPVPSSHWKDLQFFNIAYNNFSGEIPQEFQNLDSLITFNVSHNKLFGQIPGGIISNFTENNFEGNPGLCGKPLPDCPKKDHHKIILFICISIGVVMLFVLLFLLVGWYILRKSVNHGNGFKNGKFILFEKMDKSVTLRNILTATENFSKEKLVGDGLEGRVYSAKLPNGRQLAVKRLKRSTEYYSASKSLKAEISLLGRIKHRHVVNLVGFYTDADEILIFYDFVSGGNLYSFLWNPVDKKISRNWPMRFRIILGIARGLKYLHHDCPEPIIHRDIKPGNILIDEDFGAHIADFGFARLMPENHTHVETVTAGTIGYLAPESAELGKITMKSDVYSFGVVLLGLVTGKGPTNPAVSEVGLVLWVQAVFGREAIDPKLNYGGWEADEIDRVLLIGLECCQRDPLVRPNMVDVVRRLESLIPYERETNIEPR